MPCAMRSWVGLGATGTCLLPLLRGAEPSRREPGAWLGSAALPCPPHAHAHAHAPPPRGPAAHCVPCCAGGELLDAIVDDGSYTEGAARTIFRQVARGLAYLHSQ